MKRRSGFVSNSSSSSFIVGFERRPASVAEIHKILFNAEIGEDSHLTYYDYSMPTKQIAERVFADLKGQKKPASQKKIAEEVGSGYFPGYPDTWRDRNPKLEALQDEFHKKFPKLHYYGEDKYKKNTEAVTLALQIQKLQDEEYARQRKDTEVAADAYLKSTVLPKLKGKKVYVFSYADDGGEAVLEHGGVFQNLPHIQISHH